MRIHAVSIVAPCCSIWSMTDFVYEWTRMLSLWNKADKTMNAHCIPPKDQEKSFWSLMNASLHWVYMKNEFSCLIPGLCDLQENSSRADVVQDDLTDTGRLMQPNENKYFFLFLKTRRMKWIIKIRSDRAFQNLFSVCALIQHARQPDVIQNTARELLDRFILWVVYCSCIMFMCSTSDSVAGNTCFRGQTN